MDVLKFINSSALREHLKKIDYKFNGLEAAWLVYNSRDTSLDDKISAWQEIIDTYPDELFRTWRGTKRNKPIYEEEPPMLHDYLRHYINMKKRELDFITSDTHDDGIRYVYCDQGNDYIIECDVLFSSFAEALNDFYMKYGDIVNKITEFRIFKREIGRKNGGTFAAFYNKGILTDVCTLNEYRGDHIFCDGDMTLQWGFDDLWFGFPTPFKKGDILFDPGRLDSLYSGPFVFTKSAAEIAAENGSPLHDSSDMIAYGYYINENGRLYYECMHDYTSLEYYPEEELTGRNRVLKALSSHYKDESGKSGSMDDLVSFALEYNEIFLEELSKNLKELYT